MTHCESDVKDIAMGTRSFFSLLLIFISASSWAAVPQKLSGLELNSDSTQPMSFVPAKAGKASVIVFLSAKCPCSASHERILTDLYTEYHASGFNFIGVHSNVDEAPDFARAHFKTSNLPFPVLQDKEANLANELGAFKTPHVFVISPSGEILFQGGVTETHNGPSAKRHYLKDALASVAAGKAPDPKEVRVLGCIIKRTQ